MRDSLQLWLASTSSGKLREFREAGLQRRVGVDPLPGINQITPCVEDGSTFEENARKKARYYSCATETLVFADDSGLCVDALGGAPGVFSARFAGEAASDSANNSKLIEELRRVMGAGNWVSAISTPAASRDLPRTAAHYVCVIVLAKRGRILTVTTGRVDGTIIERPRGSGGFGYDPYFFYPPLGSTFAELRPEAKFTVSHRGEAFRKLLGFLETSRASSWTAEAAARRGRESNGVIHAILTPMPSSRKVKTHRTRAKRPTGAAAPTKQKPKTKLSRKDYTSPERLAKIFAALDQLFPKAECALHHANAFQLLVATILSAQCTDERVNMVTPVLFVKYPTPQDFAALNPEVLQDDIRSTGFFRNKAKSITGAAKKLVADFKGEVPRSMEELLTLPGVARKTANVVLGTAYGIPSGIVVDTHVTRIVGRLKLSKEKTPERIEQDLMKLVPRERWISFAHQVIWFGRKICQARKPLCASCPMEGICDSPDKTV